MYINKMFVSLLLRHHSLLGMRQRRNDTNRRHKVWSLTWCCEDILQEYELWRQQAEGNVFLDSPPSSAKATPPPQLLLHNSETNSSVIDQKAGAAWMRRSIIHWVRVEWPCHACKRQNGRLVNKGSCLKVKCESLFSQKAFQKRLKAFLFVLSVRKIDFRRLPLLLSRQDDERDVPLSLHFRTFVMQFHRKRY